MSGHPSLKDARLKIEWAKSYLRDLNLAIAAFRQSKPYSFFTEKNPDIDEVVVKARLSAGLSPDIQRLVGNIVTDLRSALDYMVCELSIITDGDANRSGIEFPIAQDRDEFEKAGTQRKIRRLPISARDAIGRLQPYKRGYGAPIWAMNELRRKNIHHRIVPIGHAATDVVGPSVLRAGPTGSVGLHLPVWKTPDDEPIIMTAKGAGNQYNVTLALELCLADIDGFERKPVLPLLNECAKRVTGIREAL